MKKLLFIVAFLGAIAPGAVAQNIKMSNSTGCTVVMKFRAAMPGSCTAFNSSPYISIAPSSTLTGPLSAYFPGGLPPNAWLLEVDYFNFSCSSGAGVIGYAACGLPPNSALNFGACCGLVNAKYGFFGSPGAPGSVQTADFY